MTSGSSKPLQPGDKAPAVAFVDAQGTMRRLDDLRASSPVLIAFFKVSCPTCQLTLPFLGRLAGPDLQVVPVSQDDPAATRGFAREFGLSVPAMFDRSEDGYPASNAFGISVVPTMFLVDPDGRISWSQESFDRQQLERFAARVGRPIFTAADNPPAFRPG